MGSGDGEDKSFFAPGSGTFLKIYRLTKIEGYGAGAVLYVRIMEEDGRGIDLARKGVTVIQLRISAVLAVLVVIGLAVTGCDGRIGTDTPTTTMNSQQQQLNELMSRPDTNQVIATYTDMRTELAQQLTAELGMGEWQNLHDGEESGCANLFPDIEYHDVVRRNLDRLSNVQSISTEQWPRAVETISNVASSYGFTRTGPRVDKPPSHYITILDQYGAELFVGTEQQTVIAVTTGCHLTPEAKTRGTAGT